MFSWPARVLSARSCQIWDKSFKRNTKEAFVSSYYPDLSFSDGCVPHQRTALACVTAMAEKATLQGTINSKHNRQTEEGAVLKGPDCGPALMFQRCVWKSGWIGWLYKISVTFDLLLISGQMKAASSGVRLHARRKKVKSAALFSQGQRSGRCGGKKTKNKKRIEKKVKT